jgi:hypothetical protein
MYRGPLIRRIQVLSSHGRYEYSPITERPGYCWPEGKRLAVYVALNIEHVPFGRGEGMDLAAPSRLPNQQPLVCGIALHTFVAGQPYRLRQLRRELQHISVHREKVWVTNPSSIARYAEQTTPGALPKRCATGGLHEKHSIGVTKK